MKVRGIAAALTAAVMIMAYPAGAVTVDWNDLTDAQQEEAYKSLESENESLKEQIARLEAGTGTGTGTDSDAGAASPSGDDQSSGSAQDGSGEGTSGQSSGQDQEAASGGSAQLKDTDTFLKDLGESFAKRQQAAGQYSTDQLSGLSESELWDYRFSCAESERDFYNTYKDAQFNSLNVLYLCGEYCGGLGKQYQAEQVWNDSEDGEKASQLYTAGYYNRAYALVEFHDYYGLDLADGYKNLKDAVTRMDNASGEETRNQGTDPGAVKEIQEMLNSLGFLCGTPDGICGRQTVSCIERFQVMYGFDPADGLIDDELISQMKNILAKQGG